MFKKIYLEITNNCNLNCDFCIKNNREKRFMALADFQVILEKLKPYTKYLYFHLMGEPLLHPEINKYINLAHQNFFINITTNGYLIKRIKDNHNIRQINISLHSYNSVYNIPLEKYMANIFEVIDRLHDNTYFSLRFWVNNINTPMIVKLIETKYNCKVKLENGFEIIKNVFIGIHKEFIWPSLENEFENSKGTCYALKDHIGILSNGDIVPCCLDAEGTIKLGNIFQNDLQMVLKSERYKTMLNNFQQNIKYEKLCQKCNFIE